MNSDSYYGTNDQAGNVWEWNDAVISGSSRGQRGDSWDDVVESVGDVATSVHCQKRFRKMRNQARGTRALPSAESGRNFSRIKTNHERPCE